ncbi:hypothetical protein AR687_18055 [Flavobacteriaceae bacterium CRH]|nr:hypothetical protein AR687_18055 [Flavobacteriaceae bacterium CRH]
MKKILLFIFFFYYTISNAQISFEKGYFISNEGKRTECYIKNLDWNDNPINFKYKMELNDSEPATETIATTQEFGIDNESTYKRFNIKIDRSNDDVEKITSNRNPEWKEETIFLKILVAGDATLYSYTNSNTNKYFYSTQTIPTEQLIYVKFIQADQNEGAERISENNEYKQQLFRNVKSSGTTQKEILNLKYKKNDLTAYFSKYNNITSGSDKEIDKKTTKSQFFIKITPGVSMVSTSLKNFAASEFNVELDKKMIFKIGAEAEYILPYNKNKWSIFINPMYQKYEDEKNYNTSSGSITNQQTSYNVKINHSVLQLPIGARHYMFLNQNSKIFIDVAYSLDIASKTDIVYTNKTENSTLNFDGNLGKNLAFGLGYNFKNKFSAEMRFNTKNELINYISHSAKYSSIDFIFGYTVF